MLYPKFPLKYNQRKFSFGFTLIELLVTVSIIIILLSIAVVNYRSVNQRSRDGKRKADLEQIRSAIEVYRVDCGQYPSGITFGSSGLNGTGVGSCSGSYMRPVPQDPLNSAQAYVYYYNRISNSTYNLCANLELGRVGNDPNCQVTVACGGPVPVENCDYGLTQP